jgi:hypothetical protein
MIKGSVVPSFVDGGMWSACFGLSWTDMCLFDQAGSQRMIRQGGTFLRSVAGTMGVATARNEIVRNFLTGTDGEWLFMVDTDMGFEKDTVDRLVASAEANGAFVLGALAFCQKAERQPETSLHARRLRMQPTLYGFAEVNEEKGFISIERYTPNSFQWVDGTGAACLLVHRTALEALPEDPFRPILAANCLPGGKAREFSEDLSFCARLADAGIGIGVDTAIKTTHHKGGIYLDEDAYRRQQALRYTSPIGVPAAPEAVPA